MRKVLEIVIGTRLNKGRYDEKTTKFTIFVKDPLSNALITLKSLSAETIMSKPRLQFHIRRCLYYDNIHFCQ